MPCTILEFLRQIDAIQFPMLLLLFLFCCSTDSSILADKFLCNYSAFKFSNVKSFWGNFHRTGSALNYLNHLDIPLSYSLILLLVWSEHRITAKQKSVLRLLYLGFNKFDQSCGVNLSKAKVMIANKFHLTYY